MKFVICAGNFSHSRVPSHSLVITLNFSGLASGWDGAEHHGRADVFTGAPGRFRAAGSTTRHRGIASSRRSRFKRRMTKKIIHIMPAEGWKAIFADSEGKQIPRDLVCWAALEDSGETSVEGMVAREGYIEFAPDNHTFAGYQTPSDEYDYKQKCEHMGTLLKEGKLKKH
jgi:hypothetical protein